MTIVAIGAQYGNAPSGMRDLISMPSSELPAALEALRHYVSRGVILSTCNRYEVYGVAPSSEVGLAKLEAFVADQYGLPCGRSAAFDRYAGEGAESHLLEVASGLDSVVVGETEILGQVRSALAAARSAGQLDGALDRLFDHALQTGKRVRTESALSQDVASLGAAVVQAAEQALGKLGGRSALVVGAGSAAKQASKSLADAGVAVLDAANRTPSKASAILRPYGGRLVSWDALTGALADYDVVLTAVALGRTVLSTRDLERAAQRRATGAMCLIDVSVPPAIDPAASRIRGVRLVTLDEINARRATSGGRETAIAQARSIVLEETRAFRDWLASQASVATVVSFRQRAEEIRLRELDKALRSLVHLSEEDRLRVAALTRGLTSKLLHEPTLLLKHLAG